VRAQTIGQGRQLCLHLLLRCMARVVDAVAADTARTSLVLAILQVLGALPESKAKSASKLLGKDAQFTLPKYKDPIRQIQEPVINSSNYGNSTLLSLAVIGAVLFGAMLAAVHWRLLCLTSSFWMFGIGAQMLTSKMKPSCLKTHTESANNRAGLKGAKANVVKTEHDIQSSWASIGEPKPLRSSLKSTSGIGRGQEVKAKKRVRFCFEDTPSGAVFF